MKSNHFFLVYTRPKTKINVSHLKRSSEWYKKTRICIFFNYSLSKHSLPLFNQYKLFELNLNEGQKHSECHIQLVQRPSASFCYRMSCDPFILDCRLGQDTELTGHEFMDSTLVCTDHTMFRSSRFSTILECIRESDSQTPETLLFKFQFHSVINSTVVGRKYKPEENILSNY